MCPTHSIPVLTMPQTYSSVSVHCITTLTMPQTYLSVSVHCTPIPNYAPTYASVSVSNTLYSHPNYVTNLFVSQCIQQSVSSPKLSCTHISQSVCRALCIPVKLFFTLISQSVCPTHCIPTRTIQLIYQSVSVSVSPS